jgi:hypothetical protein
MSSVSVTAVEDGHILRPCEVNQIESLLSESLDELVSSMYIWYGNWKVSDDLRNYWSKGIGCPKPFTFHPELLLKTEQRLHVLAVGEDPRPTPL